MRYTKVHLHNGDELALKPEDFETLRDLMTEPEFKASSSPYFSTTDMDGAQLVLDISAVSVLRLVTPEVRRSWTENSIRLEMEHKENQQEAQRKVFSDQPTLPNDFPF